MNNDIEPAIDEKGVIGNCDIIYWILDNETKVSECEMMKYQIQIVSFIKNIYNLNTKLFHRCLKWLQSTTKQLCTDHKMKLLTHKTCYYINKSNITISRSSYLFCKYGEQCKKQKCNNHHLVYDLLYADITALLTYVMTSKKILENEVLKSLNTINYVIYHMLNELQLY